MPVALIHPGVHVGLWPESRMPFAVRDSFLDDGAQATVVLLVGPRWNTKTSAVTAAANLVTATGANSTDAAVRLPLLFEPDDEPLWAQIRLDVGAFMHNLFRQGAFQGAAPKDAHFVKRDKETTTQTDIDNGIVNIIAGFAPLEPAGFLVIKLQRMAGQVAA